MVSPLDLGAFAAAAAGAASLRDYREQVLSLLARCVPFDAALMHALSPRVPLETAVLHGLDARAVARSATRWDELADVLSPLRQRANRRLVASATESLPRRGAAWRRLQAGVLRPFGQRDLCIMHLVVQQRVVGAIVLMSRRLDAFPPPLLSRLRKLAAIIAVGDALHQRLSGVATASLPVGLVCQDQRLSPRQREITEHVALGLTNAEIGAALGLSPHSVRNHLVRIFVAIGASNRADVVRRAVLVPAR
ncbi:MAG TPA: helix-turn-helix transcriptional regulator [Pseudomonadota bacterium]|nr:helix-turn-helix transcriptional regulator [Pseudomonadota bacterium]